MSQSKLRSFLGNSISILCLIAVPLQSHAVDKSKTKAAHSAKERLVLMPIRVPEEDKNLTGAMETALVKGLQQKYDVFSGERVAQKAHEIFMKETRNTAHTECDETRCMQNIAEAFQAEFIATANVTKQDGSYFLAISIQNIFDNKVEYSESLPCKNCDATQVIEKLKELSGANTFISARSNSESNLKPDIEAKLTKEKINTKPLRVTRHSKVFYGWEYYLRGIDYKNKSVNDGKNTYYCHEAKCASATYLRKDTQSSESGKIMVNQLIEYSWLHKNPAQMTKWEINCSDRTIFLHSVCYEKDSNTEPRNCNFFNTQMEGNQYPYDLVKFTCDE